MRDPQEPWLRTRVLLHDPLGSIAPALLTELSSVERDPEACAACDAVLVALDLGEGSGVDFVAERSAESTTPFVLVGPAPTAQVVQAALLAGAASCVDSERVSARDLATVVMFAGASRRRAERATGHLLAHLTTHMAHEGRNALGGIGGGVQIMADQLTADHPHRALCAEIHARIASFLAVIDALSRIFRPRQGGRRSRVSVRKVMRGALARLPEGADVRLIADEDVLADGEPEGLELLFSALLLNAVEAVGSEEEGRAVQVALRREGDQCVVEVADPTSRVESVDLGWVLDMFRTSDAARSGLGLPLARSLAVAQGGELEVAAPAGVLKVTVRLPAATAG